MEMRKRNETDERIVADRLAELARGIEAFDDDVLRDLARTATATEQEIIARQPLFAPRRRLAVGWTVVPVAAALLVGSGLGFGIASSATPTGEAGTPFEGFGFLPLRGWTVVQGGALGEDGSTTATAANVVLRPGDRAGGLPRETIGSLRGHGIVVHAAFTPRGDPAEDVRFGERTLPLELGTATFDSTDPLAASNGFAEQRIRAGVGSYNVDARVFYGMRMPTRAMLAAAQRQLERLVVASERVSIFARPLVIDQVGVTTLYGAIDKRAAGEQVDIQAKECGQSFFRGVAGTTTRSDGGWSLEYGPGITATLRAVWNGVASPPVVVRSQATIDLARRGSSTRYHVSLRGKAQFWRRQVQIQRRAGGTWRTVRTVTLTDSGAPPGVGWIVTWADFRASFPKGSQLRAVLPESQAKPCYLAGVSRTVRT
jgi:hypothetical protein